MRCDKNLRGRTAEEIMNLLEEGIRAVNTTITITKIANENQALEYIYATPVPGALYTVMCDVVAGALDKITELKLRENESTVTV
jgi:cyanophycin synthetase